MLKKVINISKIYTWDTTKNSLEVIKNHEILIKDDKIIKISKKIDDFTLEITLKYPAPYFEELLTHYTTYPIPTHIINKYGKEFNF